MFVIFSIQYIYAKFVATVKKYLHTNVTRPKLFPSNWKVSIDSSKITSKDSLIFHKISLSLPVS